MTWPCGISDGLSVACSVCGELPPFDWKCDDRLWATVIPKDFRRGVICLPCFARLADEAGATVAPNIECVQFTGPGYTLVLRPDYIVRHSDGHLTPCDSRPKPAGRKPERVPFTRARSAKADAPETPRPAPSLDRGDL